MLSNEATEPKIVEVIDQPTVSKVEVNEEKQLTSFADDMGFVFVPATIQAEMPTVFVQKLGMPEVLFFNSPVDEINFTAYHEFTREQFLDAFKDIMYYIRTTRRRNEYGKSENPRIIYDLSVYNEHAKIVISDKELYYRFGKESEGEQTSDSDSDGGCDDVDENNIYLIDIDDEEIYTLATRDEFMSDPSTFYGFEMTHKFNEKDFVPASEEFKPDH